MSLTPSTPHARTGDVIRFKAVAKDAAGKEISELTPTWAFAPGKGEIDADRHLSHAGFVQKRHDLGGVRPHQPGCGGDGAAHAEHPRADMVGEQPVAVEAMMNGRGSEIPDDRLPAAHQERKAAKLVALPLADLGGGDVADIVDVEEKEGAAR